MTASTIHYHRIAETVIDQLNPFEGWLYVTLVRLIQRQTNREQISLPALAQAAHMSIRSVMRHSKSLEAKGLIKVERHQETGQKVADTNVYSLVGAYAPIALWDGQKDREGSDSKSLGGSDSQARKESNTIPNLDDDDFQFFQTYKGRFGDLENQASLFLELKKLRQQLGPVATLEVMGRCQPSAGRSWYYVQESMENALPPTPLPPPPVVSEADETRDEGYGDPDETAPDFSDEPVIVEEVCNDLITETADSPAEAQTWTRVLNQFKALDTRTGEAIQGAKLARVEGDVWYVEATGYARRLLADHRVMGVLVKVAQSVMGSRNVRVELAQQTEV